jgi:hypothetical protein
MATVFKRGADKRRKGTKWRVSWRDSAGGVPGAAVENIGCAAGVHPDDVEKYRGH